MTIMSEGTSIASTGIQVHRGSFINSLKHDLLSNFGNCSGGFDSWASSNSDLHFSPLAIFNFDDVPLNACDYTIPWLNFGGIQAWEIPNHKRWLLFQFWAIKRSTIGVGPDISKGVDQAETERRVPDLDCLAINIVDLLEVCWDPFSSNYIDNDRACLDSFNASISETVVIDLAILFYKFREKVPQRPYHRFQEVKLSIGQLASFFNYSVVVLLHSSHNLVLLGKAHCYVCSQPLNFDFEPNILLFELVGPRIDSL